MTDKSFGDHMSRNVVKNPLLSSAVTGLSIEDLTHNAVLLPVSRSQEVITRSDEKVVPQNKSLGYPEHATPINQSGDAKSYISQSQPPYEPLSLNQNVKIEKRNENKQHVTREIGSKACQKSDDDFDVTEYFARLQSTRYISAPINTSITEDSATNLVSEEENLEEINLNEPEKSPENQSLTADIAQNFSQLPTVLPQVASAVFSSFSNMLSMKSREDTTERVQNEKQEVVQDNTVNLMSMPEVKEVAPPPKEPPIVGATNYRLLTKKKYAQIPGLSSSEAPRNLFNQNYSAYNQPPTSVPSYFVPTDVTADTQPKKNENYDFDNTKIVQDVVKTDSCANIGIEISQNVIRNDNIDSKISQENVKYDVFVDNTVKTDEMTRNVKVINKETTDSKEQKDAYMFYNPNAYTNIPMENKQNLKEIVQNVEQNIYFDPNKNNQMEAKNVQHSTMSVSHNIEINPISYSTSISQSTDTASVAMYSSSFGNSNLKSNSPLHSQSNSSIIPPPPMFSNAPRRESLSNTAKSVLPPSVARRISSKHPYLKPQALPVASFAENIFVPTMPLDSSAQSSNAPISQAVPYAQLNPSSNVSVTASVPLIPSSSTSILNFSNTTGTPISNSLSVPCTVSTAPPIFSSALLPSSEKLSAPSPTPMSGHSTSELSTTQGTNLPPSSVNIIHKPPMSLPPRSSVSATTQSVTSNVGNFDKPVSMIFNPLSIPQTQPGCGFPPNYYSMSSASSVINLTLANPPQSRTEVGSVSSATNQSMTSTLKSQTELTQPVTSNVGNIDKPISMTFNPLSVPQSQPGCGFPPNYYSMSSASSVINLTMANTPQSRTEVGSVSSALNQSMTSILKSQPELSSTAPISFFNPNQPMETLNKEFANQPDVKTSIFPLPIANPTAIDPPKIPIEPPKAIGNTNFRLTKKKPQYYAGPIEGVGAISNNVKPILDPVQTGSFQGALFTPNVVSQIVEQPLETSSEPFDISKQSEVIYTPYELGKSQQQTYGQSNQYNTAFDLSRTATENYETDKQEGKGFGIIGSLKSKLSSIDINRIQNTVTTFFDPAYNEAKTNETMKQENVSNEQPVNYNTNNNNNQQQSQSNFEIFVPNVDLNQYNQLYGSQNPFQYQSPNYNTPQTYDQSYQYQSQVPCQQNQYYQSQEPFSYYQDQDQNVYTPNVGLNPQVDVYNQDITNVSNVYCQGSTNTTNSEDATPKDSNGNLQTSVISVETPTATNQEAKKEELEIKEEISKDLSNVSAPILTQYDSSKSFFDKALPHVEPDTKEVQNTQFFKPTTLLEDKPPKIETSDIDKDVKTSISEDSDTARELDETKALANALASFTLEDNKAQNFLNLRDQGNVETKPSLDVSSAALLGLSTMLADKSKELSELESDAHTLNATAQAIDTIFNRGANSSFFDDLNLEKTVEEVKSELDICETCREVDRPDDKEQEPENLTDQLIENITSPIQLLNPVEVPLTESNEVINEGADFITKQLEEISHITEETIETIHVQSATDMLDEGTVSLTSRNYGWATESTIGPQMGQSLIPDSVKDLQVNPTIIKDHDYGLPNLNAIGFFGNTLFTENTQNVDDVKTEIQFAENPLLVLPRQMSIPSAPPAEEDSKSDETGIDVHSIEQDAKKDFLLYEEFVIEPSSTDVDNLELKEAETIPEENAVFDSFTNRVERFKKMEECNVEQTEIQNNIFKITDTTSPSLPIPSYFDTGNYAVETHYRNSISSPSSVGLNVSSPNNQVRVPPGFEEEFSFKNKRIGPDARDDNKNITPNNPVFDIGTKTNNPTNLIQDNYQFGSRNQFEKRHNESVDRPVRMHKSLSEITSLTRNDNLFESSDLNEEFDHTNEDIPIDLSRSLERAAVEFKSEDIGHSSIPLSLFPSMAASGSSKTSDPLDLLKKLETESPLFSKSAISETKPVQTKQSFNQETSMFDQLKIDTNVNEDFNDSKIDGGGKFQLEKLKETQPFKIEATESDFDISLNTDNIKKEIPSIPTLQNPVNVSPITHISSEISTNEARSRNIKETPKVSLPDPINFFASTSTQQTEDTASGFGRLASYFASPTKTSDNKSFFELSQLQDRYREDVKSKTDFDARERSDFVQVLDNTVKNFFDNNPSNIKDTNSNNISRTEERYTANMNLINDLTSPQNIDLNPELNINTINYFTIESDQGIKNKSIGEPSNFTKLSNPNLNTKSEIKAKNYSTKLLNENSGDKNKNKTELNENIEESTNESEFLNLNCKRCCDLKVGNIISIENVEQESVFNSSSFKVKNCMNGNHKDGHRDNINNMDSCDRGESSKKYITLNMGEDASPNDSKHGVSTSRENRHTTEYTPVRHHWFYRVDIEDKSIWRGFSVFDSNALEKAYQSPDLNEYTTVPTDGGRYDVNVIGRLRTPVYWADKPTNVRRCSWFYKGTADPRYVPYTESVAEKLEEEYRRGVTTGEWHRRLVLPNKEMVVMHGASVMVHFLHSSHNDAYTSPPMFSRGKRVYRSLPRIHLVQDEREKIDHLLLMVHGVGEHSFHKQKQSTMRPRVVRRGVDESEIEDLEPTHIDHLLLLCHGVGSACDMRLRTVEQVVNDFRATSLQLLQSHYKTAYENGVVGRVEVLPISWHATLHSGATGVDKRLARITLDSIPKLRNFTNDTVLDVLFYTSPVFAHTILETVCAELNRIYRLFRSRNPSFGGAVSVGGHSLGSVILYDLLQHQPQPNTHDSSTRSAAKTYVSGVSSDAVRAAFHCPLLEFQPAALYALGSPIAIFETIRGVESLGLDFSLPTCKKFFNIFHPYDPIAYRIEPLVNPALRDVKAVLIPHHKGRKRMHLELKDTIGRVSSDLKHKLVESIKTTWSSMWRWPADSPSAATSLERVVEEEGEKEALSEPSPECSTPAAELEVGPATVGRLNNGRRIDYVLQEAPFEMINEYLFAMTSHVCYWESEDTMLMILREIYDELGIEPDCTIPQQSLTVQREKTVRTDLESSQSRTVDGPSTSEGT